MITVSAPRLPAAQRSRIAQRLLAATALVTIGAVLASCSAIDRLANVGEQPALTTIQNPTTAPGYRAVSMPMPPPLVAERQPNSLWRAGSRSFFKDLRANRVGDIVTVIINLNETGTLSNTTRRSRSNTEDNNVTNLLGFQGDFKKFLPDAITGTLPNLLNMDSALNTQGAGSINRAEQINLRLAAIVVQTLPNGNLVLHGRQEVRLNYEVRELQLGGVIRPEDISPQNTINYDQIAEARVSYGGRGQIMDVQQPRYGTQVLDIILPF